MFVEAVATIGAKAMWEQRKSLTPLFRKLGFWFRHSRLHIPIFGPGGTGKSTLALLLSGESISPRTY